MRTFVLLLLAANLALFAWMRFYAPSESASDAEPLGRQVAPEKIRVIGGPEIARLPARPKPEPAAAPAACIEWGGFAVAEAPRGEQALEPLALGARLTQNRTEESAGWWVFIPPQPNRAAAAKKAAELKALGIEDYFIVQDEGPQRWALSLGVFRSEDAARSRLDALKAKGVRSAQTGQRETRVAKVWFQVRNAEPALQAKLRELAQGLPGTEVRDCN